MMSDDNNGGRFNAMEASHEQVQQYLRLLGLPGSSVVSSAATPAPHGDRREREIAERAQQRVLNKRAREAAHTARLEAALKAERGRIDGRTSSAAAVEERTRQLGLDTISLGPFREVAPPQPPAPHHEADEHRAVDAAIDAAARELLRLEQRGMRIDAREIADKRVFSRYLNLKLGAPGWQTL